MKLLDLNLNVIQQYNLTEVQQGYPSKLTTNVSLLFYSRLCLIYNCSVPELCVKSVCWRDESILVGTQNSEVFELSSRSADKVSLLVEGHSEGELWALATHPTKGNTFATSSDDCTIQQWSITG